MTDWAYIYEHPEKVDPIRVKSLSSTAHLIAVQSNVDVPQIAADLVARGVALIELCGGMDVDTVARTTAAVAGAAAVGHVTFSVDSLVAAARYVKEFEGESREGAPVAPRQPAGDGAS